VPDSGRMPSGVNCDELLAGRAEVPSSEAAVALSAGNHPSNHRSVCRDHGHPDSIYAMFHVVILVHALVSGWHDIYRVGTEFQSFKLCEVARTDLANDFKEFLERRHSEPFQVQSKCVNLNDEI